jgi:nuclear pore complex protein Nup205
MLADWKCALCNYSLGLVAVLLYHDGRRCLLSALRTLLQSREGLTWTLELDEEMSELIMSFTKQIINEGR